MTMLTLLLACAPYLYSDKESDTAPVGDWTAPENTWPSEAPPEGTSEGGFREGEIPPDFRLMDQKGDEVSLWQFYGHLVVVDISALWCGPCQELAKEVEHTQESYEGEMIYLTLLPEDLANDPPDLTEIQYWADAFGISAPVLSDDSGWSYNVVTPGSTSGFPRLMLIGRDLRIIDAEITPTTDAALREAIDANL